MKKIVSLLLACILAFSCLSMLASADSTPLYRDEGFEFYVKEDGAYLVNVLASQIDNGEIKLPSRVCNDDDRKIGNITVNSVFDDDNETEDPFGVSYVYLVGIDAGAFDEVEDVVTSIYIPRYLTNINVDALRLSNLESISVNDKNAVYASSGGSLYNAAKTEFILHPAASSDNTILSTVTKLDEKAFMSSDLITSVTIPAGVTSIPDRCFYECFSLKTVDMSAAKIGTVGAYAFYSTALTGVEFSDNIKWIKNSAFQNVTTLKSVTIPEGAKNVVLGSAAFLGCPIENLLIYRSVIEVGKNALGYYFDSDLRLAKYEDFTITSYKYNEARDDTTALFNYADSADITFIPLDPKYSFKYTSSQLSSTQATLYLYKNNTLKYELTSSNGEFYIDDIEVDTYRAFVISKFGVLVYPGMLKLNDSQEGAVQSFTMTKYEPIGDVNRDNSVNIADISMLLLESNYSSSNEAYDIDADGVVGISDISIIIHKDNFAKTGTNLPNPYDTPITPI